MKLGLDLCRVAAHVLFKLFRAPLEVDAVSYRLERHSGAGNATTWACVAGAILQRHGRVDVIRSQAFDLAATDLGYWRSGKQFVLDRVSPLGMNDFDEIRVSPFTVLLHSQEVRGVVRDADEQEWAGAIDESARIEFRAKMEVMNSPIAQKVVFVFWIGDGPAQVASQIIAVGEALSYSFHTSFQSFGYCKGLGAKHCPRARLDITKSKIEVSVTNLIRGVARGRREASRLKFDAYELDPVTVEIQLERHGNSPSSQ
ncbi:MAG: hypothetical protein ACK4WH_08885 [Phycisphaerales bacterium]